MMSMELIRDMLAWCTVINLGILIVWFLFFSLAQNWIYALHNRWFKLTIEQFNVIHYAGMALFKIGILLFNLVPYLALRIVG